ncbi:MAG: hypothetical protein HW386_2461, partial [Gammaproteobacteria bacterium]|nr:hypothetical protein [Gammaproteobacteria bacterium]
MFMKIFRSNSVSQQSGAALLILMLVLVIASSYLLITNLNNAARRAGDYQATMQSLNMAKQALIGYAVNYSEID